VSTDQPQQTPAVDGAPVFLALQGGGVDGIAHLGAARVLHTLGAHYPIDTIVGTSAGSAAGALIASGISDDAAKQAVLRFPYADLEHRSWLQRVPVVGWALGGAANLVVDHGVFDGGRIQTDVGKELANAGIRVFGDYDKRVASGQYPLAARFAAVAYDVDRGIGNDRWTQLFNPLRWADGSNEQLLQSAFDRKAGEVIFPQAYSTIYGITNPDDMLVSEAVSASSRIPFVFTPAHIGGDTVVDGGVVALLPHDEAAAIAQASGRSAYRVVNVALGASSAPPVQHPGLFAKQEEWIKRIRHFATQERDRMLADPAIAADTITVDIADISATRFTLTSQQQELLYDSGMVAALDFATRDAKISLSAQDLRALATLAATTKSDVALLNQQAGQGLGGLSPAATARINAQADAVVARISQLQAPGAPTLV
jgi:predicted acylesterase/phospholipase RssA